jgi:hypothetical protein
VLLTVDPARFHFFDPVTGESLLAPASSPPREVTEQPTVTPV